MNLEFLKESLAEFEAAVDYYEDKDPGLGGRFKDEVYEICATISKQPLLWRDRDGCYRRVNLPVFPYYIAYFIRKEVILVAAVAHESRHPDYWKRRLQA